MKKSKIIASVVSALLAVPCVFTLAGCNNNNGGKTFAANKTEVYAFSALSSAEYLSDQSALKNVAGIHNLDSNGRPDLIKNDISTINEYVGMFEGFLFNGGMKPVTSVPSVEADGEQYATYNIKLSMSIPNSDGTKTEYTMYYNEVNSETNIEEDEEDGETEVETETSLEGVLLFGNEVFEVNGEKSVETEGSDTEVEIKFTTRSKSNRNNYIVVKQEMEQDEVEFEYSIYENGLLKSKNKVEWESENGEQELDMQFINLLDGAYSKTKYNFEKFVKNDKNIIKVKYKNGKNMESFTITDNGLTNIYLYDNGFTEEITKAWITNFIIK